MSGLHRGYPTFLIDSTGAAVGFMGRDGREWLFPAALTVGADAGAALSPGRMLYDDTGTPQGISIYGREFAFGSPFTLNTTGGLRRQVRPFLVNSSGVPIGVAGLPGGAAIFAVAPTEGGAVVGPTLPQSAHLVAQWSADSLPTQATNPVGTDNGNVVSWVDIINGYTASQATGANQPKFRTAALGGKPGVQFSGTTYLNGLMAGLKTVIDGKTYSVLILADKIAVRSNASMFGNSAGGNSFCFQANGTKVGRLNAGGTLDIRGPYTDTVTPITCGYTSANFKVYPNQTGTGLERQYLNGTCIASTAAAGPLTSSASGAFGIGCISDLNTFPFQGYLYEILVWDRQLTEDEMMQAEIWVRNKYSLALPWASLPYMLHFDGNSHTVGVTPSGQDVANSFPYLNAQSLGLTYGQWCNHAVGGMNTYGMYGGDGGSKLSDMLAVITRTGKSPRVVASEYYNETITGRTANAYADLVAYAAAFKAAFPAGKLGWWNPFSYGTDAATYATNRGPFLASVVANYASIGIDVIERVELDTNIGTSDANTNFPGNWAGDAVHLTAAARTTYLAPHTLTLCQAINN